MATKFLGKVVACAALGGASLLIAPGVAIADGGYDHGRHDHEGKIFTHPKWAKAAREVTIVEICPEPQKHAWAWSKVTGKLSLKPKDDDAHSERGDRGSGYRQDEDEANGSSDKKDAPPAAKGKTDKKPENGAKGPEDQKGPGSKNDAGNGSHTPGGNEAGGKNQQKGEPSTPKQEYKDEHGYSKNEGEEDSDDKKWVYAATVKLPWDVKPGHYEVKGSCGSGTLLVTPKGWVDGGDGGATGTDPVLAAGGAGMLGAAALGGILLIRRRRTDGSPA